MVSSPSDEKMKKLADHNQISRRISSIHEDYETDEATESEYVSFATPTTLPPQEQAPPPPITPSTDNAIAGDDNNNDDARVQEAIQAAAQLEGDIQRATNASLRDAVGAFAITPVPSTASGSTLTSNNNNPAAAASSFGGDATASPNTTPPADNRRSFSDTYESSAILQTPYTNQNLPPNIDIIAEATLAEDDTLGLGWQDEPRLGGVYDDSASVAISAITTPYTPTVAEGEVNQLEVSNPNLLLLSSAGGLPFDIEGGIRGASTTTTTTSGGGGRDDNNVEGGRRVSSNNNNNNNIEVDEVPEATAVGLEADCEHYHHGGGGGGSTTVDPTAATSGSVSNRSGSREGGGHGSTTGGGNINQDNEPVQAQKLDKYSVYALGHHYDLTKWHFLAAIVGCLIVVVACVAVPVGIVVNNNTNNNSSSSKGNNNSDNDDNGVEAEEPEEPEPVLMELPVGISPNEECEYRLYENKSTLRIESVFVNDEPITVSSDDGKNEGGTTITARPGSRLRVKGKATTCADWCPTCLSQLYVTLMNYDEGSLYDPCKYLWAEPKTLVSRDVVYEEYPDVIRPPRDATSDCFDYRMNNHCPESGFDIDFVLDPDSYPADDSTRYGFVLSVSYEYLCQAEMVKDSLHILGVSEEFFLQVEGEAIVEEVQEVVDIIETDTAISQAQECDLKLYNNTSTFAIDEVFLNNVTVTTQEEGPTTIVASPGDTIRVKGKAATCASKGEGEYWCPGCWVQLYVSLMSYDEDGSLYDPCEYLWAPQVLYDGYKDKGGGAGHVSSEHVATDSTGGIVNLIRPSADMTSQCIEEYRLNGSCDLTAFDKEIVVGDDPSVDGATAYGIVLSASYEYYCQESLLEKDKLRILSVSDDYSVQVL